MQRNLLLLITVYVFSFTITFCFASNITHQAFGSIKEGKIAAFGDFNSDEFTDVFLLSNKSRTLQILLGSDTEPLLRTGPRCDYHEPITSVVPGDFDGDALMDVLITVSDQHGPRDFQREAVKVFINWGNSSSLNCSTLSENELQIKMLGEPLAIDYDRDMIIDLFGMDYDNKRSYWVFQKDRTKKPDQYPQTPDGNVGKIFSPHAHAYLDLNGDYTADLFIQTQKDYGYHFELWYANEIDEGGFYQSDHTRKFDPTGSHLIIGQTIFLDMEMKGEQNQILPLCFVDSDCKNSSIQAFVGGKFHDLHVNFKDPQGQIWGFVKPGFDDVYLRTITARGGDFNMDGYPDLLVTLSPKSPEKSKITQTFLLENVPCEKFCAKPLTRTFEVKWNALYPMGNNTVAGAFYDFYQDGVLDVLLIEKTDENTYRPLAFRNTLDYDSNFVKVIVLTGLINKKNPTTKTPLGRKKRTYGTNLPGPKISYYTTTQEGDSQYGSSVQLPQSAYFALQLPYTIFGLGRTPNFVDSLTVGLGNRSRTWTQIIPNSQMIVIPNPGRSPSQWKAQLFVTPSKLILMSVFALGGTCLVIILIILGLYIKEKREDKEEKMQEPHRFHFDAM